MSPWQRCMLADVFIAPRSTPSTEHIAVLPAGIEREKAWAGPVFDRLLVWVDAGLHYFALAYSQGSYTPLR